MISAVVIAPAADAPNGRMAEAVVRSLGVLVSAAVADLVRDAWIVGAPGGRLESLADHAGCGLVENADPRRALCAAMGAARCERVFLLQAGFAPGFGFIDEMSDWLQRAAAPASALRRESEGFAQRLFPALAPVAGVVARKSECLRIEADGPAKIARALRAKTLRTRARRLV